MFMYFCVWVCVSRVGVVVYICMCTVVDGGKLRCMLWLILNALVVRCETGLMQARDRRRTWYLRCDSERDRQDWKAVLKVPMQT